MSEGTEAGNCISWSAGNSILIVLLELVLEAVAREGGRGQMRRRNGGEGASWRLTRGAEPEEGRQGPWLTQVRLLEDQRVPHEATKGPGLKTKGNAELRKGCAEGRAQAWGPGSCHSLRGLCSQVSISELCLTDPSPSQDGAKDQMGNVTECSWQTARGQMNVVNN